MKNKQFVYVASSIFIIMMLAPVGVTAESDTVPDVLQSMDDEGTVMRSSFSETRTIEALSRPVTSSGWVLYDRNRGLLRIVEKPFRKVQYIGDDGLVIERSGDGDVKRLHLDRMSGGKEYLGTLLSLFKGDLSDLDETYRLTSIDEPGSGWGIRLKPRGSDNDSIFESLEIRGDTAGVRSVEIFHGTGNRIKTTYGRRENRDTLTERELALFESLTGE